MRREPELGMPPCSRLCKIGSVEGDLLLCKSMSCLSKQQFLMPRSKCYLHR
jgi:hypothetical protein